MRKSKILINFQDSFSFECNYIDLYFRKNSKDVKPSAPKSIEKKIEPRKAPSTTGTLPPIQSKEVLLLEHDFNRAFAKRKIDSNWDRYAELSDEEDDPQKMAADFDKILLAPKSIGEFFTFSIERAWEQTVDADAKSNTDSPPNDLFKLNLNNLRNGVGRLPFYLRNELPLNLFSDDEITDMNYRANYYENNANQSSRAKVDVKSLTNPFSAEENHQSNEMRTFENCSGTSCVATDAKFSKSITKLAESTGSLTLQPSVARQSDTLKAMEKPINSNESENIQDWLDDILNDK